MGVVTQIFERFKAQPIDGGRKFKDDKERRAVMLERNRPVIPLEEQVAVFEKAVQSMQVDKQHFAQLKADFERLTLFIRDNYAIEIDRKEPQHQGSAVDCAIHYMKKERSGARGIGPQ